VIFLALFFVIYSRKKILVKKMNMTTVPPHLGLIHRKAHLVEEEASMEDE